MNTSDIERTVSTVISEELQIPVEQLRKDTDLRELPGVESIRVLRIIAKLERTYDLELEDDLVFRVRTLGELVEAIRERQGAEQAPWAP